MNKTKVQCDNCPAVFIVQDNMFVRQVEDGIGGDHPHQGHAGEVEALGDHLGAD